MFKRFLKAWKFTRDLHFEERYDELPWDENDSDSLQRFMLSPAGAKFRARLQNLAIAKALESVAVSEDPLYRSGTAYGIQLTNLYIDSHLPDVVEEVEVPQDLETFLNG